MIFRLVLAAFMFKCALAVQCYACHHFPCTELTCEGSWCMKTVLHDRVKGLTKTISDCVPEILSGKVKESCEDVRLDELGIYGRRCFCRTKLCNGASSHSSKSMGQLTSSWGVFSVFTMCIGFLRLICYFTIDYM